MILLWLWLGERNLLPMIAQIDIRTSMQYIIAALQQLEKLTRTNLALRAELNNCLYSRNTLTSLSKLLVAQDFDEYIREMTQNHWIGEIHWEQTPFGISAQWKRIFWRLLGTMKDSVMLHHLNR